MRPGAFLRYAKEYWGANDIGLMNWDGHDRTLHLQWNMKDGRLNTGVLHALQRGLASNYPTWRIRIALPPNTSEEGILIYPMAITVPRNHGESVSEYVSRKAHEIEIERDREWHRARNLKIVKPMVDSWLATQEPGEPMIKIIAGFDHDSLSTYPGLGCVTLWVVRDYVDPRTIVRTDKKDFEENPAQGMNGCKYSILGDGTWLSEDFFLPMSIDEIRKYKVEHPIVYEVVEVYIDAKAYQGQLHWYDHRKFRVPIQLDVDVKLWTFDEANELAAARDKEK